MRSDVLKSIAESKDVTNAIILTHNIDFVFLQTLVLSTLRKCGHPTITVFADAQCAAESFANQALLLDGLGARYRVVPVAMAPGFRFHPKAVLLSGIKDASLFVGSGNLTYGGWRENAEVWVRFDSRLDGPAAFEEFNRYTQQIIERVPLSDVIREELAEAFDAATRGWVSETRPVTSQHLLGRAGSGVSILESLQALMGGEPTDELVVCSPYFDGEGAALRALIAQTAAAKATVLYQSSGSSLTRTAFEAAGPSATIRNVSFEHVSGSGERRAAFVHAKYYALLRNDEALVVAGSANCSRAALTSSGSAGNAELMALRRMPVSEFQSAFVDELQSILTPAVLANSAPEMDDKPSTTTMRVLAARFEAGVLLIGFSPKRADIQRCEVDGTDVAFSLSEPGVMSVACSAEPRLVRVAGLIDQIGSWSAHSWIDIERLLRASARGRSFADCIRARARPGDWHASAWADVMDTFCKHLTYMPTRDAGRSLSTRPSADGDDSLTFSYADVFSSGYRTPALSGLETLLVKLQDGREHSLQQLLLRWFGVLTEAEGGSEPMSSEIDGEDEVDRPEKLVVRIDTSTRAAVTDADKQRIQKVLRQVEDAMTTPQFLASRSPNLLATDLKVAAVLLRVGLREQWVGSHEFFRITHSIWASLFLSGSPDSNEGWLEHRLRTAEDKAAFVGPLRSPELAAALLGWAFAVVPAEASPEAVQFQLSVALAVARLGWLWDAGDEALVARELEVLLANTGVGESINAASVTIAWEQMLRRGHALLRLEEAAGATPFEALREKIRDAELRAGDLLWQGVAGYCVVTQTTSRLPGSMVPVLKLQTKPQRSSFCAEYTMPIRSLLKDDVIACTSRFGVEPRRELSAFLDLLQRQFGQMGQGRMIDADDR